jgi:hypothetical protein
MAAAIKQLKQVFHSIWYLGQLFQMKQSFETRLNQK